MSRTRWASTVSNIARHYNEDVRVHLLIAYPVLHFIDTDLVYLRIYVHRLRREGSEIA